MAHAYATPDALAAFVRAGDRDGYVRAWYRDMRAAGLTARRALHLARVFWGSYLNGVS